jgi:predicted nucleic-acid-binding protein
MGFELTILQADIFTEVLKEIDAEISVYMEDLGDKIKFIIEDTDKMIEALKTYEGQWNDFVDSLSKGLEGK